MTIMKLQIYFHTIKYLKLSQIYHRIIKRFVSPKPHDVRCDVAKPSGDWLCHAVFEQKMFGNDEVKFLNKSGAITDKYIWNDSTYKKIWLYNLHYFDDLSAAGASERCAAHVELITRWMDENPAGTGKGWEPYPTSLRVVNWIKAFLGPIQPNQQMLDSLAKQVDYLSQDLERHLLGNHLLANAKALIFAGLYFAGDDADNWLNVGLKICKKELEEQVLADGGNFELSPMYHITMMVDILDLINLFKAFSDRVNKFHVQQNHDIILIMMQWLEAMTHHDNKISFFNDSAFGIAPHPDVVYEYARLLGLDVVCPTAPLANELQLQDLTDTGYVCVKSTDFSLIADLAEVGPSYQPAHAHADTLSFELALFGQRVFVNSGISQYGWNKERLRQRQTAAHNTVVVNELNSSQVWDGFRVAKRANILDRFVKRDDESVISFGASHNGFKQQTVNCIHRRTWQVLPQSITVCDHLVGDYDSACGYLHLHPAVKVDGFSDDEIKLSTVDHFIILKISDAVVTVDDSTWHPEFGIVLLNKKLCFQFKSNTMRIEICWGFI